MKRRSAWFVGALTAGLVMGALLAQRSMGRWRGSLEHKPVCVPLGMGVMGILEGQLNAASAYAWQRVPHQHIQHAHPANVRAQKD